VKADEARFEALARQAAPRLLGYVTPRVDPISDAADVVAEVLLIAWRRLDAIPADNDGEAVLWLLGVARRVLANHRRGRVRRHSLAEKLRSELAAASTAQKREHGRLREALSALAEVDRELISLHAWEGLSIAEAARVLGIRPATARKRLERARRKLDPMLRTDPRSGNRERAAEAST